MTDGAPYLRIRQWAVLVPSDGAQTHCSAKRCGRVIPEGEQVALVAHEERSRDDPGGKDVLGYLCDDCCASLGDRLVRESPEISPLSDDGPHVHRGKAVPSW